MLGILRSVFLPTRSKAGLEIEEGCIRYQERTIKGRAAPPFALSLRHLALILSYWKAVLKAASKRVKGKVRST